MSDKSTSLMITQHIGKSRPQQGLHVCHMHMYVLTCMYSHACTRIHVLAYMYSHTCTVLACMYSHACTRMHVHVLTCMYMYSHAHVLTWYDIHMNRICVHLKGHVDHSQREGVAPGGKVDHMEDGEGGVYQRGGLAYQCGRYGGRV